MAYRRFYITLIIRVLLILATSIWFSEALRAPWNIYTLVVVSGLLILQVISLVYSINRVNRSISSFFDSIQEIGSSVRPHFRVEDNSFRNLSISVGRVADMIHEARKENERQLGFLKFVLKNIPAGLIIVNSRDKILEFNQTASSILGLEHCSTLGDLGKAHPLLQNELMQFKPGYSSTLKLKINNALEYLHLKVAGLKSGNDDLRILTVQNITREMEENELDSWQKLTRVLTHEIMNSLTPISSLAEAARKCLTSPEVLGLKNKAVMDRIEDTLLNLDLIDKRNAGIRSFVSSYKRVSQVPVLNPENININQLVKHNLIELKSELEKNNITLDIEYGECPDLYIDEKLAGQVLTNILRNAIEAMTESDMKKLKIRTLAEEGRVLVEISDSGKGIPPDDLENIFTPFYTTREKGMGIGLSLSRQIMRLHKGSIKVVSSPDKETRFTLVF
ncbi:MAG: ATP-binding protein [Marinilabiliaceae bacterium]|jgi:nitrogen fixation/metabolism regulation signal transduction histidine kinase|nr:ATP-binding protein [Marinilabiliaceae bacterium]